MVDHREEAFTRAMELMHFCQEARTLLVQSRVLDGRGGHRGEKEGNVLILLREGGASQLLREVKISENPAASADGNAEK